MKLIKSKKADENYLSKIVKIGIFRKHNDPSVECLKCTSIDGFNAIEHEGKEFWISKKYIAKRQYSKSTDSQTNKQRCKVSK